MVKTPGDTLNGYINFYDWDVSPDKIEFMAAAAAPMQVFRASEVHGFYLVPRQEWYYAKKLQINFYATRVTQSANLVSRSLAGTFFLKQVVKGDLVSLYLFTDEEKTNRFFAQKGGDLSELLNYRYTYYSGDREYEGKATQYINQLKILLGDCPAIKVNDRLPYSQAAISALLTQYHACKGGQITSRDPGKKTTLNPVIQTGMFRIIRPDVYVPGIDYVPTIGIGLKVTLPGKFSNKYALIQVDRYYYRYTEAGKSYTGKSHHLTALAGTHFGKGRLRPFVHAGIQLPSSIPAITLGAGVSYARKLSLELRSPGISGIMGTVYYTFGR